MKRSEINAIIQRSKELLERNNFRLPDFAYWSLDQWRQNKHKVCTLHKVMMGWDITDFSSGKFNEIGAVLFTIRNGDVNNSKNGTPYAEKVIILSHEKEQRIPIHCHRLKSEDIINRGGGILCIQLYGPDANNNPDTTKNVEVYLDGIKHRFRAGEIIEIRKGNSITLRPYIYHAFWARSGDGDLIVGEVSSINDDKTDNIFAEPRDMFLKIEEDTDILHPLVHDYDRL